MLGYARKVDGNQQAIVTALRQVGASVIHLHTVGHGCPDLLVGYRGVNHLIEIKADNGRMTQAQLALHGAWRGAPVIIVRSVDEALQAIGAI